jgi:starch synthase
MIGTTFIIVHHANQYLITDGYDNRDGITSIANGYEAVLRMHQSTGIPANLHLSGTLLEALAWHRPQFVDLVRELLAQRVIALVGGTYSENIMPVFGADHNGAQLRELARLYADMLDYPPDRLTTLWIPERVWTPALAPLVTDPALPNGGYEFVLLDDRLLFCCDGSDPYSRASFDSDGPFADGVGRAPRHRAWRDIGHARRMAGCGLTVLPISAHLRYWIPPRVAQHWQLLEQIIDGTAERGHVLVYADDLEKTAGVGGWANDVLAYGEFMAWLSRRPDIRFALLDDWRPERAVSERRVEVGTFYELARAWGAGEDYKVWAEGHRWRPYRSMYERAAAVVEATASAAADRRMVELARKHLLASAHETAWHDEGPGGRAPAPWSKAIASHARDCLPMCEAARSLAFAREPSAEIRDVDEDGVEEVVMGGTGFFIVVAPHWGGRIVALFHDGPRGGVMSIGNPTDHWNFQETLNRFMDRPANHPGALADAGFEHDVYEVSSIVTGQSHASVELVNVASSAMAGARKTISAGGSGAGLSVCYRLPDRVGELITTSCLSPDYLALLREGARGVRMVCGDHVRGATMGGTGIWIATSPGEATSWTKPLAPDPGHGVNVAVNARSRHWHLAIAWSGGPPVGDAPRRAVRRQLAARCPARKDGGRPSAARVGDDRSVGRPSE